MKSLNYQKEIKQTVEQLLTLERKQKQALLRDRMRFLRLLKSGEAASQALAGKQIGLGLRGAEKMWKKYRTEGISALLDYPFKGRRSKLSQQQKQQLDTQLKTDRISTLAQACAYVKKHMGLTITVGGMHYVFKAMKIKKKTGRPTNVRKDHKGEKQFKKKFFPP